MCDFANAIYIDSDTNCSFIPSAGTVGCKAPEILKEKNKNDKCKIDLKKADIFSLGVLLFTMVVCKYPFSKADSSDYYF